jgi:hypothetical protein
VKPTKVTLALALAVLVAVVVTAAVLAADDQRSPVAAARTVPLDPDRQATLLEKLEAGLPRAVGPDYGCVLMPAPGGQLVVHVVSRGAAERRARRFARRIGASERAVTTKLAPLEAQHRLRRDLVRRLRADAPDGLHGIDTEEIVGRSACPRVVIVLPGDPSAAVTDWARSMVAQFGSRRLTTETLEINQFSTP